ncbi:hypothetical protein GM418_30560 [Maribellus comscasis]|uniref:Uncharacterized protein n=1 Tax=Maribellus comscasis TaxID=2681766 RepID=A0A6I6K5T7_9BACT|nr:hypothetical protein [Maribellus comscasis]QGY47842.1 hypothetical protein GM418_30560 [Maribellus comscasis]
MNETEYFLDSIPDSINPNWIDKIEVLKSEVQKYIYGDGNGVVLIYPNKKYFDQISLLLKTYPNIQEQINEQTLDSIYIKALNSHLTYYYRVDKNSLSQTSRLKGLRIILDRIAFTNFSHQTSCLITPTNMVKL